MMTRRHGLWSGRWSKEKKKTATRNKPDESKIRATDSGKQVTDSSYHLPPPSSVINNTALMPPPRINIILTPPEAQQGEGP